MDFESKSFSLDTTDQTLVIAEVGVNHNGDPAIARKLIDAIQSAGADIVKLQLFHSTEEISKYAPKAPYQEKDKDSDTNGQMELCQSLELSPQDVRGLKEYCLGKKMPFLCTAFDSVSLRELVEMGLKSVKIPSPEITNIPFLREIGGYGLNAVLSTGASTLAEVEVALNALKQAGAKEIALLHCVSSYPTPPEDVNLRVIPMLRERFKLPVGLSDHTQGIGVPIAAAALGAALIEKHITLDRKMPGPDHFASIEPDELKTMMEGIRAANRALGVAVKNPAPSEMENRHLIRKSLVAKGDLKPGTILTPQMIGIKRPEGGAAPADFDKMVGRRLKKPVLDDFFLTWDDVE